ncbi:MAG: glycosyltransferase family 4 protein [Planctomycetota bacterium]
MKIAIVTAGGAGMFCGSCLHDNDWARALLDAGEDVTLVPLYTPLKLDRDDLSADRLFFGGVNVYMRHHASWWRRLPRAVTRWLDHPRVLDVVSRFGVENDAATLGPLTLTTLAGINGPLRPEIEPLVDFLADDLRPDAVFFSNVLLAGVVPPLRARFDGQILGVLQGDDLFLDALDPAHRAEAVAAIARHGESFDAFVTHSADYASRIGPALGLPAEKFRTLPLTVDAEGHGGTPRRRGDGPFTVGYFARLCPEKGFGELLDAFGVLHRRRDDVRLVAGGYLHPRDRRWFERQVSDAFGDRPDSAVFVHAGSPDSVAEKSDLIRSFDVLSVPTVYREPKGLPVLEAWANGVPVVQPRHGAFPEMVEGSGGGLLVTPGDAAALADAWESLIDDEDRRLTLAEAGHAGVRATHSPAALVAATRNLVGAPSPASA